MSLSEYHFIDAASLEASFENYAKGIAGPTFQSIDLQRLFSGERKFYFDAIPSPSKNEDRHEYEKRVQEKEEWLQKVEQLPYFHVHSGLLKYRKKRGYEQKGVDVLLAAKALMHAFQGNVDVLHLWASDLDFYPVLETLQLTRVRSVLHYDRTKTSKDLLSYADVSLPIELKDYLNCCDRKTQTQNQVNWLNKNTIEDTKNAQRGKYHGKLVLYKRSKKRHHYVGKEQPFVDQIYVEARDSTAQFVDGCGKPKYLVQQSLFEETGEMIEWE